MEQGRAPAPPGRCLLSLSASAQIRVQFPFDAVTHAQLRGIRPCGTRLPQAGEWHFPLEAAPALLGLLGRRFAVDGELNQWLDWLAHPLPPLPSHRQLLTAAALEDPLADGRRLLAHQRVAVRWLLARRGALLADAMGLGKTLTALAAARALVRRTECRIVVLAPAGLHQHWRQEALALGLRLELHSWARPPADLPPAGCVLIADEAHYAQNLATARTQAFLRLARHPRLRAIWLLTGTPMRNGRPDQLFPLLAAIGHPVAQDRRGFEQRFCDGHWREQGGRLRWEARGVSDLESLRALCRPLVLHRRKQDCLELPPKRRRCLAVNLDEVEALGFQHRLSARVEDYRRRAGAGLVRGDAEPLAMFTALREIASSHKLPAAVALVQECLARGEPVVLFSAFVASVERLQEQLGGLLLTGRVPVRRRQGLVDAFQHGHHDLLLATFGTGGLGFTLHRARHVVLLERPWTPGDAEQAEDRCHRLGMAAELQCHWLQLGVADQLVDGLIASKAARIEVVLHGRQTRLRRQGLPAMVRRLIEQW